MSERRPAAPAGKEAGLATSWAGQLRRYGQESGVWLALSEAKKSIPPDQWAQLLQILAKQEMAAGKPALFHAVFMFFQGGDVRWLEKAAAAMRRFDEIERHHAFTVFVWGWATASAGNRRAFRKLFELGGFPAAITGPADSLARSIPGPKAVAQADDKAQPVRRVAILCQQLATFTHAGTRLALEHAALLSAAGVDVCMFSAQEMRGVDFQGWLGCPTKLEISPAMPAGWKPVAGKRDFKMAIGREFWPQDGRWRSTAASLAGFAPDAVLFVGFFSPLLAWVWKHYPVIGLSVHTLPPLGSVDVWLHQFEKGEALPKPWAGLPRPTPVPYAFRLALPPVRPLSLESLKLPSDSLIMMTAGYRLRNEVRQEWATQVLARLDANPRWVWILVGSKDAPPCVPTDHPRIRVLPHQENFDGLMQQCSLYLNPQRMGGGLSIMNAMARGVPAVSMSESDGGDKLGPWSAATMPDYWRRVDELMGDDAARARCGQALLQRYESMYDLHAATPSLLAALEEGRSRFRQRKGADA